MRVDVKFSESNNEFTPKFGEVHNISDGGYERGDAEGEQSEDDRFWDSYQDYGKRDNYYYGFSGVGWTDETFNPKYDIVPISGHYYMFSRSRITDLKAALERNGVVLDTSNIGYALSWFEQSEITVAPTLDLTRASFVIALNTAWKLKWVDRFILSSTMAQTFQSANSFRDCTALEHIIFEGVIRTNGFNMQWSPLDKESLISIINAVLESATITITLSLDAVNKAFETSEGAADGSTSAEWLALIATKPNCTVSLA